MYASESSAKINQVQHGRILHNYEIWNFATKALSQICRQATLAAG